MPAVAEQFNTIGGSSEIMRIQEYIYIYIYIYKVLYEFNSQNVDKC